MAVNFVVITSIAVVTVAFGAYFNTRRPLPNETLEALIDVNPTAPVQREDGGFDFPIVVTNIGKGNIEGYLYYFRETGTTEVLSYSEEESLMADVEATFRRRIPQDMKIILEQGQTLPVGQTILLRQPVNFSISKEDTAKIRAGGEYIYYGFVAVFVDREAQRSGTLFYAESCVRSDPTMHGIQQCAKHNFGRRSDLPPTGLPSVSLPIPALPSTPERTSPQTSP
jgi:hypothetical protein